MLPSNLVVDLVSRAPGRVQNKLLVAFLTMVALLIISGAVGLRVLSDANQYTKDLITLQRKIESYRQVQLDATSQLYRVSAALLTSDQQTLNAVLRQINQFGYDVDRLQFVARDEVQLLERVRQRYDQFVKVATHAVGLIGNGRITEAREIQLAQATPLADRLERLTNQLVNRAEADMVAGIEKSERAYTTSQWTVIAFALASIMLALCLGYAISWSIVGPVTEISGRLAQIAAGDFTQRARVVNRDELGTLANDVNHMCEELGRLYRQIEEASKHKSQFLANMSHELRTPLNAILGYTELIIDSVYGNISEEVRTVLARVQKSGQHLLGLINDVLDLSKIEAGQLTLSVDDYSIKGVVQNVLSAVESLAAEKRLALNVEIQPNLPMGSGDERRLTQVLLNLVGNAIKFTDEGQVGIKVSTENDSLLVAVSDTGPGIAESNQARIFEEFQQAEKSTAAKKGGTGLGLAISKRIIEMHGGSIWVESSPGHGATFLFKVPAKFERQLLSNG
jgi:signal transduction histidine kinase